MKTPDIPHDETERIETLHSLNVLDTLPEERFERLTRMAKRMFGVPIALVSLIDENRQWFKSSIGVDVSETSREISFCGHAILGESVFIVQNACEDPRFADNPLVLNEPNIRFYAGCPLKVNGQKLGTLCIIDQTPRDFDEEDVQLLKDLAAMVERELTAIQMATMDELTDISNRRGFMTIAQHSLNLCIRQDLPVVLVFLDLDKFKPINDTFGHAEGDAVLIAFAGLMKKTFRNSDVFARLGGDEFAILLSSTSKKQAEVVINKLSRSLEEYNQEMKRGYVVSYSHGIVEFNQEKHQTVEGLLADGDALMYRLKKSK
ncbi:GGDEF domain-containing protein [Colwellia sp. 75C3]|uniref:sensor domain-containing diguanylate cyclase n=1 Tax=Colwellia sp. 75C3 TaxID=888425 RepID=UPI000C34EA7F|nr:sensor domain-containing diguanylate cyclase [Colwellia sp. 75C3]PKG84979.1 GGDEF domain-containing protein [Colwellia sp. 75C3]